MYSRGHTLSHNWWGPEIPGPLPLVRACNWSVRVKKKTPFYRAESGGLGYKTIVKVFQNFLELYQLSLTASNVVE